MHGEQSQCATVRQPVMDEVETPAFIRLLRRARGLGATDQPLLASTPLPHLQALGPIQPIDSLVIVVDTAGDGNDQNSRNGGDARGQPASTRCVQVPGLFPLFAESETAGSSPV